MADAPLVYKNFYGGQATDLKSGIKSSSAPTTTGSTGLGMYAVDFRKSPSQLTVLPGASREDGGVVNDLVQNEVMVDSGVTYSIGSSGNFYRRTTAGVWSLEANIGYGTFGLDYRKDSNSIYIPTKKSVSLYNNVSGVNGTAGMIGDYYAGSYSTYNNTANGSGINLASYQMGSGLTTAIGTSIIEDDSHSRFFQSDIEPLSKIGIFIPTKGTGNWTLTLHDGLNNVLATSTIATGSVVSNTINYFSFTNAPNGQVRIYVKPNARTYHYHLTSTVADGTVSSSATDDLSTCDCEIWADRLIQPNNLMHPMARFQQYECFGNANYLSIWEPISTIPTNDEWLRHKLVFPSEYEVCGLAVFNEFLAIACEKTTTASTSVPQEGIIFFWDGLSDTYNYLTKIPEGSPYCLHEYKNAIYYYAGGSWYGISSPTSLPVKIRTMPGTDTEYSGAAAPVVVNPYAATVRRGIHLMGWPSTTTSTSVNYGVYSWGSVDKNYPDSFGLNYLVSTGSTNYSVSNNLTIGMVQSFGDLLHISWRDTLNGGYGVDVISNTSTPAVSSAWESLIYDNGYVAKQKKAKYIQATFLTLPSDCSFKLKYKLDRASSWTYSDSYTLATTTSASFNSSFVRFDIASPSYFYEIQIGCDITSGTTTPTFTSFTLVFDDGREESLS